MTISPDLSKKISLLSSVSMLLIVLMHGVLPASTTINNYLSIAVFHTFTRVAVPVFFMISGFLLFNNKYEPSQLFPKIANRACTLLVPYILWSIFAFLFFYIFTTVPYTKLYFNTIDFTSYSAFDYIKCFTTKPINAPLWFIRDLYLIVLCSPLILFLYKNSIIVYYTLLIVIVAFWIIDFKAGCFFFDAPLFFNLGFLCSRMDNIDKYFLRDNKFYTIYTLFTLLFLSLTVINTVLFDIATPFQKNFLRKVLIITGIIAIPFITNIISYRYIASFLLWFKKYSFITFVTHSLTIQAVRKVLLMFIPQTNIFLYVFTYIIEIGLVIIIGVITLQIIKSISPKLLGVLTGGR